MLHLLYCTYVKLQMSTNTECLANAVVQVAQIQQQRWSSARDECCCHKESASEIELKNNWITLCQPTTLTTHA